MSDVARLLLERGDAAARAAEQKGRIYGQLFQNLGQIPGEVLQEHRQQQILGLQQQRLAQQGQLTNLELQKGQFELGTMQQTARERSALDAIYGSGIIKPDGSVDLEKAEAAVQQVGMPHLLPQIRKQAMEWDAGTAELKAKQLAAQQAQANLDTAHRDQLGVDALGLAATNYDPGTFQLFVAKRVKDGMIPKEDGEQLIQASHTNPASIKGVVDGWIGASKAARDLTKPVPVTAGTTMLDPITKRPVFTAGPSAADLERVRHDQATERLSGIQAGRETAADAETARHHRELETAANPLGGVMSGQAPGGPQTGLTGEAYLKTLPPPIASEVKAYAEGRRPFPTGFALKTPYFQMLIQAVGQYDPTFDAVNYNARAKTRADFTSGKSAQTINALNTVTQHLDQLSGATDQLKNTWSPTYNSVANFLSKQSGAKVVTNFETTKKAVTDELTRAWRQAGGTEADIKSWSSVLDAANSPEQLHGAIAEMGHLLEGKLSALENQYQQGMGTTAVKVVTPEARATLQKLEQRAGGSAAPPKDTTVIVVSPSGKQYPVRDQAAAEAFIREAKAKGLWK